MEKILNIETPKAPLSPEKTENNQNILRTSDKANMPSNIMEFLNHNKIETINTKFALNRLKDNK